MIRAKLASMMIVDSISVSELLKLTEDSYGDLVKADVDLVRNILLVEMEMHADGEAHLLEDGSKQEDLWGINLYPAEFGTENFIEFDSMINLRPRQGNRTRGVDNETLQSQIVSLVMSKVHE